MIANEAVKIVKRFETLRTKKEPEEKKERCGYDIKSGNRLIEVKGMKSKEPHAVAVNVNIKKKLSMPNYYIYIVNKICNKQPKMKILYPKDINDNKKGILKPASFKISKKAIDDFGKDMKLK